MAYIKSELEKAVELVQPKQDEVEDLAVWFEEMEKALLPLRYFRERLYRTSIDDNAAIHGYLAVFLDHADSLLADAWRQGWTNHPKEGEQEISLVP